ncbi:hypothetical protein HBI26_116500 [Parastagonospora nodorum]|nr:hypothetical protein HBI26_116500 [Parastagonospora nodorum]
MKLASIALFAIGAIAAPVVERQAPGGAPPFPSLAEVSLVDSPLPLADSQAAQAAPAASLPPLAVSQADSQAAPVAPVASLLPPVDSQVAQVAQAAPVASPASPPQPHRPETRTFRGDKSSVLASPLLSHFKLYILAS